MILGIRYWIRVLGIALEIIAVPVIYKNRSPLQTVCVIALNNRAEGILLLYLLLYWDNVLRRVFFVLGVPGTL